MWVVYIEIKEAPERDPLPVDNKASPDKKDSDSDPIPVKISRTVNNMSRDGLNRFRGNNRDESVNTKTDCFYIGNIGPHLTVKILAFLINNKL